MHSIEEMEEVSFDESSGEDDSEVVEQSLIKLYADSSSEYLHGHQFNDM